MWDVLELTDVGCPGTAGRDRRAFGYTKQQLMNWFFICQRLAIAPSKLLNPWTARKLEYNKNHLTISPTHELLVASPRSLQSGRRAESGEAWHGERRAMGSELTCKLRQS